MVNPLTSLTGSSSVARCCGQRFDQQFDQQFDQARAAVGESKIQVRCVYTTMKRYVQLADNQQAQGNFILLQMKPNHCSW